MVPLMNHIHFSSMTLIQVVGCFFPPLLPEIATQPQVRAMLDLALYNVQMQIKLYKWKREYKRTRVPAIDRAAPGLKVWIDDLETSLHQISRENESKVYGLPIEQDETLQWERIRWRHLKRKDEMFQAKLKESICLADSQTKSLQVSKEPLSVTKISVDEIPSTAEKSFRTSLHHLKFAVELKPNGAKLAKSLVSCERVARLPIDYFVWKTCDCMYKLHVTNQKCMLGIGMRRSSPIKLQDKIDRNILDVDWQARNEFRLFYLVKRPHRYTLAWSDRYFGKAIHQNRIELSVEYMSLLVLGSPIIGVGNEYIWRLDLGRHVYAPLNWYTFRSLLPLKSTGRMVTWPVDAVAVDWQDQLLFVSGRMYQQRESIACKRNSANQQDTPEDAVIMPTLKYSPCRMLDDRLMTGRDSSNLKLPTVDQLSLSPKCYIYSITRKRMQEVGSLGQERCNHVVVKCWIDNEERVLAIGGENRFGKQVFCLFICFQIRMIEHPHSIDFG